MTDPVRVHPRHAQQCGYCLVPGVKTWLEAHDLSWSMFIREGIPINEILSPNDALGNKVARVAQQEADRGL